MVIKTLLSHIKPKKAAKVIFKCPSGTDMTHTHLVTNPPVRNGLGRADFRRKLLGTKQLLKAEGFSQSFQI